MRGGPALLHVEHRPRHRVILCQRRVYGDDSGPQSIDRPCQIDRAERGERTGHLAFSRAPAHRNDMDAVGIESKREGGRAMLGLTPCSHGEKRFEGFLPSGPARPGHGIASQRGIHGASDSPQHKASPHPLIAPDWTEHQRCACRQVVSNVVTMILSNMGIGNRLNVGRRSQPPTTGIEHLHGKPGSDGGGLHRRLETGSGSGDIGKLSLQLAADPIELAAALGESAVDGRFGVDRHLTDPTEERKPRQIRQCRRGLEPIGRQDRRARLEQTCLAEQRWHLVAELGDGTGRNEHELTAAKRREMGRDWPRRDRPGDTCLPPPFEARAREIGPAGDDQMRLKGENIVERYLHAALRFRTVDIAAGFSSTAATGSLGYVVRRHPLDRSKDTVMQPTQAGSRVIENLALVASSLIGMLAFALPFLTSMSSRAIGGDTTRSVEGSLLLGAMIASVLIVTVAELVRDPGAGNLSRSVALLGALVAVDAALRLIPTFLGASPIFALIILVGYVFGSRFGFAMGALTLLLSAAITAGIGPWLPFQMLCAGWIGLAAGWLPPWRSPWPLVIFAAVVGFAYGALMNLYAWPFTAPGATTDAGLYWTPGLSVGESVRRYLAFYLATSAGHDAFRAVANVALVLVAGPPVVRLLQRFKRRTTWTNRGAGSAPSPLL